MFHRIKSCRACQGTDLVPVLDLGIQPLANDFKTEGGEWAGYAPLKVLFCRTCTLAQLSVVVRPEILYKDYPYVTSSSDTMKEHFSKLLIDIGIGIKPKLKMLEVGSNNGEFLIAASPQFETLGIEPAKNLAAEANTRGVKTICRLFDPPSAIELGATGYRADVIVARHVFAHVDDWKGFIRALEFVSHKNTLVVIEVPWVVDMIENNSFDQVYHEHLSYVSIGSINKLLEGTEFLLHDVKHYTIHGGAIALMLRNKAHGKRLRFVQGNPKEQNLEEQWLTLDRNCLDMIHDLFMLVKRLRSEGKTVCGFGASAKASVWINACGFSSKDIQFVIDSTEQKQGRLIPGTDIGIVNEYCGIHGAALPDYLINFSWNFHLEIAEKHKAFTERGGKWILPVPKVRVL